jgi:hypothetical protein
VKFTFLILNLLVLLCPLFSASAGVGCLDYNGTYKSVQGGHEMVIIEQKQCEEMTVTFFPHLQPLTSKMNGVPAFISLAYYSKAEMPSSPRGSFEIIRHGFFDSETARIFDLKKEDSPYLDMLREIEIKKMPNGNMSLSIVHKKMGNDKTFSEDAGNYKWEGVLQKK